MVKICVKTVNIGEGHLKHRNFTCSWTRFKALICAVLTSTNHTKWSRIHQLMVKNLCRNSKCCLRSVLYSAPPIPAGIHRNPQEWDRNPQESTGMGPVKSSIPATVLVEHGRTWNPVGILHLIDVM